MQNYYYIALDICSFLIPFLFSFEKKWMNFIRFWKPFFSAIILVGLFFIIWDIYFAFENVWGFNNEYLIGIRWFKLPLEEWLFFLLIPYASNFIHYSLEYFFPKLELSKNITQSITIVLFIVSLGVFTWNLDKIYTAASFGLFSLLMLFQMLFQWKYARRFYLSFIVIYIPFFFVNSALTGSYSENPVVFYNNNENLGIRVGTMPLEDSFYCFSMLYGSVLLFEYFRRKWNYSLSMSVKS
ncbi:lycopene cyclase domain-containing protein [Cloacibacterium sp.]|uniref:lycopene cyclase domain-containing protein n=1 Tax=Cloacibacterium sp. TaxID=1913682 RepID=UPI0035B2448E